MAGSAAHNKSINSFNHIFDLYHAGHLPTCHFFVEGFLI